MQRSISRNIVYKAVLNIASVVLPLLSGMYVMRVLSVSSYSLYSMTTTELNMFMSFGAMGIYSYAVRQLSKRRDHRDLADQTYTELFVLNIISNAICFLLAILYMIFFSKSPLLYFLLSLQILFNLFQVDWAYEALEDFKFISIKTILVKLLYLVLLLLFLKKPDDIILYAVLISASMLLNNIASFIALQKKLHIRFQNCHLRMHFKPLFYLTLTTNIGLLYDTADKLFLGYVCGPTSVAYYFLAFTICALIISVFDSIYAASVPRLNALVHSDWQGYHRLYHVTLDSYLFFVFPACLGMLSLAPEIITIYGTEKYLGSTIPLQISCLSKIFISYQAIVTTAVYYVNNKEKRAFFILFLFGLFNLLQKAILSKFGWLTTNTALWSSATINLFVLIVMMIDVRLQFGGKLSVLRRNHLLYFLASLLFLPICEGFRFFAPPLVLQILLSVSVCALIYAGLTIAFQDTVALNLFNRVKQFRFNHKNTDAS